MQGWRIATALRNRVATKRPIRRIAPRCVSSDFGIFVSPSGKPDASGKKDEPVNSITAALAKTGAIRRVYVCEGTYDERVTLKAAISIYGGFNCADWSYSGTKAVVGKPQEPGYTLDVQSVSGPFEMADLELVAANGNDTFPNSIATRFVGTSGAVLRRVGLTAQSGRAGRSAGTPADGTLAKAMPGNGPQRTTTSHGTKAENVRSLIGSRLLGTGLERHF
jgi:hypothetical protein